MAPFFVEIGRMLRTPLIGGKGHCERRRKRRRKTTTCGEETSETSQSRAQVWGKIQNKILTLSVVNLIRQTQLFITLPSDLERNTLGARIAVAIQWFVATAGAIEEREQLANWLARRQIDSVRC